jgi:uncharacterized repeat protein (TIGR01451 family)
VRPTSARRQDGAPPRRRALLSSLLAFGLVAATLSAGMVAGSSPAQAAASPSERWIADVSGSTPTGTSVGTFDGGVTATVNTSWDGVGGYGPVQKTYENWDQTNGYWSPSNPQYASGWTQRVDRGAALDSAIRFSKPIIAPRVHMMNVDASYVQLSANSASGGSVTFRRLSGNNIFTVDSNSGIVNTSPRQAVNNGCQANDGWNPSGACGSVEISGGLITGFGMYNREDNLNGDGWAWSLSYPTAPLTKQFSPNEIEPGETSQLTFTIANPANEAQPTLTPLDFTDRLPSGVSLKDATATTNGQCGAPTYDGLAAESTTFTAGSITVGAGATCQITVNVTADNPGTYVNDNSNLSTTVANLIPNANTSLKVGPRSYTVSKTSDKATAVQGDKVQYTVTVKNTGDLNYTSAKPATFTDDLSKVLDDAVYNGDASNGATVNGSTLSWSGTLAPGETKTITYSVTVDTPDEGDLLLDNVVSPDTSIGGSCDPDLTCATSTPVKRYKVDKTADKVTVGAGDRVTYTITVTNTGKAAYTEQSPASFDDDLSKVTDDAVYNDDATNGATVSGNVLSWAGPLAVDETKTVTYSVTVNNPDTGDKVLENAVVPTGDGPEPPPEPIIIPVLSYTVEKTADKTEVNPGEVVTYTVTVTNTGEADYTAEQPASFTDDLSKVTDDATYNGDATNGATVEGNTLSWSGTLAKGETKTITYSFTVNKPATGDRTLENAVVPKGPGHQPTPPPPFITKVGTYSVEKAVDKTQAKPGDRVTYTITVRNTGQVDYTDAKPASFTDDLSKVTDDAAYNGDVTNGAVVSGNTLSWTGALAVGETKTIVYSFTVNTPDNGDKVLANAVVPTGPGGDCTGACATRTGVTPPGLLAATGGMILAAAPAWPWIGVGAIGFAVLIALGIARVRRARTDATDED